MDKIKLAIAQPIDFTNTDTTTAQAEVRSEVRSLEDSELAFVGGGENIPNW